MSAQVDIEDVTEPESKLKTADLQALLAAKYPKDRYALFFDVPDNVGTNAHRRADAIVVGCWASVGRLIEGFELKVSRGDWLKEVSQVNKADPFIERCDKWWLVTGSPTIAKLDEIPACWGWMAATKSGLRVQRPATKLPTDDTKIHRLFAIGLFRKMQGDLLSSPEVVHAIKEVRANNEKEIEDRVRQATQRNERRATEAVAKLEKFEKESGIDLDDWRLGNIAPLIRAIADLSYGNGMEAVAKEFERQETALTELLDGVRKVRQGLKENEAAQ